MATQLNMFHIDAFNINDAWFQCVKKCVDKGYNYHITRGSYAGQNRKAFDFITGVIRNPGDRPLHILIPEGSNLPAPNDDESIDEYFANYLMSAQISKKEDYTYGERLVEPKVRGLEKTLASDVKELDLSKEVEEAFMQRLKAIEFKHAASEDKKINPLEEAINMYVDSGFGTNQATLEIAMPTDILLKDPPCLRLIDTRIRYGKLHFMVYFRSWDLVGGFPSNLAAIQLMKEFMVNQINEKLNKKYDGIFQKGEGTGLQDGELVFISKGLHIYDHQWEYANMRIGKDKK